MLEQTFKKIDDMLRKDAGCSSELDYVEQTSWIIFLKYLEGVEQERQDRAELSGQTCAPVLKPEFQWKAWAAPKDWVGKIDHHAARSGDDLKVQYKIEEIFSEIKNKIQSGHSLRDVVELADGLPENGQEQCHV